MGEVWVLALVMLLACADPVTIKIGPAFPDRADCERALADYAKQKGPPAPGSRYACTAVR